MRTGHQTFLNLGFKARKLLHGHAERLELLGGRIDGEVVGGHQHAGGDKGHDGHEAFHQHGAVAHEEHVAFVADHLRGRTRADRGVEARERAAGDRDEDERNDGTAHDRAAAVDEVREGRHLEVRHHEGDADGEGADRADLEEGGEVVARQQQEPHGKNGGEEAVDRDEDAHRLAVDVEPAEVFGMGGDPRTGKDAEEEEHDADDRRADHVALAPDLHVEAHQNGDGNRRGDRVGRPERVVHGVDHGDREARERQDQNREDGPRGDEARRPVDLLRRDVGERAAAVAHGAEEHDHVVHAACEHAADQNPEQARHVAELRCENWAEKRAGCRNGCEMVAKEHVLVGRDIVLPVAVLDGRRLAGFIEAEDLGRNEETVEAVSNGKDTERGKDDCQCVDSRSCFHVFLRVGFGGISSASSVFPEHEKMA